MTANDFAVALQQLVHEANASQVAIDDLYAILHGQSLIMETLLKLEIEQAYKERFK